MTPVRAQRDTGTLAFKLASVRKRIDAAAMRSGGGSNAVRLVAVTKGVPPNRIQGLLDLGETDLAENRVQEALEKIGALGPAPTWHLVGHLQRNKVKAALEAFSWIHSVDSLQLGQEIERRAEAIGHSVAVLLQVNVAGEPQKFGFDPDELLEAAERASRWQFIRVRGLMTIAPLVDNPETVRPIFRRLRVLRDHMRAILPDANELSMGMTDDFEVAIEEGATMVRIGRAIFGERT